MLEHHCDSGLPGIMRRRRRVDPPVELHLPFVGTYEAVDRLYQRRLSGTVLAQKRMNLASAG